MDLIPLRLIHYYGTSHKGILHESGEDTVSRFGSKEITTYRVLHQDRSCYAGILTKQGCCPEQVSQRNTRSGIL